MKNRFAYKKMCILDWNIHWVRLLFSKVKFISPYQVERFIILQLILNVKVLASEGFFQVDKGDVTII